MSFRRRGDIISKDSNTRVFPYSKHADILSKTSTHTNVINTNNTTLNAQSRGNMRSLNEHVISSDSISDITGNLSNINISSKSKTFILDPNHPGVRPSRVTSQPTTSTGCGDLDKLLGHMGLPLGCSLLIEEQTTTDFSSILLKLFASQGIVHNRVEKSSNSISNNNTHIIILSLNQLFAKDLPGVYKGSTKEVKKMKVSTAESKMTVQNLTAKRSSHISHQTRNQNLKIAWRYGLTNEGKNNETNIQCNETYPHYIHKFDITSRLIPAPTTTEISYVSPLHSVASVLTNIETIINKNSGKLIRILIPNLLHPVMYPPKHSQLKMITSLLYGLRFLLKKYKDRCVLMANISVDLYLSTTLVPLIRNLFDSIINLQPFQEDMLQLLKKVYKTQPEKILHGLIHVYKLPVLSDRGEMHIMKSEWAFRNSKKRFEIEEWGILVNDIEDNNSNNIDI